MATTQVHPDRIRTLHDAEPGDGDVLYWMQRAQRARHNDALEHAIQLANDREVGLRVLFVLDPDYPEASRRHFRFMLEGLAETAAQLRRRGIGFTLATGDPVDTVVEHATDAGEVVVDRAYLRHLVGWRQDLAARLDVPVQQVEADVIVPVEVASDKREYAARTIRKKLNGHREEFLVELDTTPLGVRTADDVDPGLDLDDLDALLDDLDVDDAIGESDRLTGGTSQAQAHLDTFLSDGLAGYGDRDPDPVEPAVSYLSAYLHYGQISPVAVALAVLDADAGDGDDREGYVEELLVRRELAVNFVRYTEDYDAFSMLPDWARTTLDEHRDDEREDVYTASELEQGETHDRAWNACMAEVRETGYLHNHLRMYWGKQVVAWTNTPEHAYRTLLDLNNRYFLDGRDCASYANVGWVFGLHDRAWQETDVRGKTRPMNRNGLDRKIDVDAYVADVEERLGISLPGS